MDKADVEKRVIRVIVDWFKDHGLPKVTSQTLLREDLGLDFTDVCELAMELEDAFDVDLVDALVVDCLDRELKSVENLVDFVCEHLGVEPAPAQ